jgi:hypothetical protein
MKLQRGEKEIFYLLEKICVEGRHVIISEMFLLFQLIFVYEETSEDVCNYTGNNFW